MSHHHPLDPLDQEVDAVDRHLIQLLGRSAPLASRLFKELLDHSRRMQRGLRGTDPHSELPSVAEVLTIEQCGYPRTYNLNDGMGLDVTRPGLAPDLLDVRLSA